MVYRGPSFRKRVAAIQVKSQIQPSVIEAAQLLKIELWDPYSREVLMTIDIALQEGRIVGQRTMCGHLEE